MVNWWGIVVDCAFCGEGFVPRADTHKCCSRSCSKQLYYREHKLEFKKKQRARLKNSKARKNDNERQRERRKGYFSDANARAAYNAKRREYRQRTGLSK